ncbi:MAG: hypothetical protein ACUZ8E_02990 [Candidatus Anammoxibacter sp.]
MKLQIVLSSVSIILLIGAILLGLMVMSGRITPSVHMMVAFSGAMISIIAHAIYIGNCFKKK